MSFNWRSVKAETNTKNVILRNLYSSCLQIELFPRNISRMLFDDFWWLSPLASVSRLSQIRCHSDDLKPLLLFAKLEREREKDDYC